MKTALKINLKTILVLLSVAVISACGGGGGGDSSTSTSIASVPTSFWKMDAFTYVNGGFSASSAASIGAVPVTVVSISTATLSGGDLSNGAYSGSGLTFSISGSGPGIYNITPSKQAFVEAIEAAPTVKAIVVEVNIGTGVTSGSSMYTAAAGQISVSVDSAGKYHFDSIAPINTTKTLDVLGGVSGARSR